MSHMAHMPVPWIDGHLDLAYLAVEGREIWFTGRLSPRAHEETEALGIVVHENAFPTLQPPPPEEEEGDGEDES